MDAVLLLLQVVKDRDGKRRMSIVLDEYEWMIVRLTVIVINGRNKQ